MPSRIDINTSGIFNFDSANAQAISDATLDAFLTGSQRVAWFFGTAANVSALSRNQLPNFTSTPSGNRLYVIQKETGRGITGSPSTDTSRVFCRVYTQYLQFEATAFFSAGVNPSLTAFGGWQCLQTGITIFSSPGSPLTTVGPTNQAFVWPYDGLYNIVMLNSAGNLRNVLLHVAKATSADQSGIVVFDTTYTSFLSIIYQTSTSSFIIDGGTPGPSAVKIVKIDFLGS